MAFQVSPGVNISEIDASTSVPAIVTSTGAMVGRFAKGPVSEIVDISSEEQLLSIFGAPDDTNYKSWFTAANFLSYSSSLKIVRVVDGDNAVVANRARNALSGKVTASTSASGAEQAFLGAQETETTIYGSSEQIFTINTNGSFTTANLHAGLSTAVTGGTVNQHLHPRSSTVANSATTSQGYTILDSSSVLTGVDASHMVRTLTGSDFSVFLRQTGETTGGLVPASRYSLNASATSTAGQEIQFADNIGNTSISGPYYIHHSGTTGNRLVTSGVAATAMTTGFTWPLYKRQSSANVADSGLYGGSGTSHVHYFTKYGGVATAETVTANTLNLDADHGLTVGDPVLFTNSGTALTGLTANTVYYIASVATNAVTLSASYDYASTTAGTVLTVTGTVGAAAVNLYNAFYMPSSTMNHSKSTAPTDAAMKPYASSKDTMTFVVAHQSSFQLRTIPGAYAVNNNLVISAQSAAGTVTDGGATDSDVSHSTTDYSVNATNKTIVFSENLPRSGQTETVTVPAQKAFTLSPAVNLTNGETVSVQVSGVTAAVGSAVGQYVLSANGDTITFGGVGSDAGFAPAHAAPVKVNITSRLANSFVYDTKTVLINNKTSFESSTLFGNNATTSGHEFAARTPGVWGSNLHVYLIDESSYDDFVTNEPSLGAQLTGTPRADDKTIDTSATVIAGSESVSQGISMIVTDVDRIGNVIVVEVMENMSKAANGVSASNKNLYYVDTINASSAHVYVLNHPVTTGMDWGTNISTTPGSVKSSFAKLNQSASTADGTENYISRPFGNGSEGNAPKAGHFTAGFDKFADAENVDCAFLLQGESADLSEIPAGTIGHMIGIAESRKDCVACISPTEAVVVADKVAGSSAATIAFYRTVRKSNYAFADSNYKYIIDKYSAGKYRFVPFNGDTAGLMVRSELDRDAWFSPAGFNRGVYKGVVKTMVDQTKANRDDLYKEAINPVVNFSGQGTVLFGDKTFTMKSSAFDRINVRRLFIVLEKSIATAAKFTLFEFNDEFTRAQFTSLIEPFLRDIKGRRGIFDFKVVCDSTNNTANVIDTNQFVGDIFIQPARSINFIQLNFVAVRTGVSFDEIVGVV